MELSKLIISAISIESLIPKHHVVKENAQEKKENLEITKKALAICNYT